MRSKLIYTLILLAFLIPNSAFASECSKFGYTIETINGVFTNIDGAIENRDKLQRKLPPTYRNEPLTIDYLLNPSHLAGLGDILVAAYQKYFDERAVSDYDLTEMIKTASEKVRTQKLLLVAHSQGNFYGNSFYDTVADKPGGVPKESIGVYGVASPATRVAGGGLYLTSDTDQAMNKVKGIVGWILQANTHIELKPADGNGHSFSDVYLKYRGPEIISGIQSALAKLTANSYQLEANPCIFPPKLSLLHKTTGVILAVADPVALGTKKTAQVAYAFGASVRDATSRLAINISNLLSGSQSATAILADNTTITTPNQEQSSGTGQAPTHPTQVVTEETPPYSTPVTYSDAPIVPEINTITALNQVASAAGTGQAPTSANFSYITPAFIPGIGGGGYSQPKADPPLAETPYATPYPTPYETPYATPYETPYSTPYETPYSTPYATPYETPYTTPYATPYATPYPTPALSGQIVASFASTGEFTQNIIFDCTTNMADSSMMYAITDSDNTFHFMNGGNNGISCPSNHMTAMSNGQKFADYAGYADYVGWYYISLFTAPNVCFFNSPINCVFNKPPSAFARLHRNISSHWSDTDS